MCGHPSERQGSSASEQLWVGIIIFSKKLSVLVRSTHRNVSLVPFALKRYCLYPLPSCALFHSKVGVETAQRIAAHRGAQFGRGSHGTDRRADSVSHVEVAASCP